MANQKLTQTKWAKKLSATTSWVALEPIPGATVNRVIVQNVGSGDLHLSFDPVDGSNPSLDAILPASVTEPRKYDRLLRKFYYMSPTATDFVIEGWFASNT